MFLHVDSTGDADDWTPAFNQGPQNMIIVETGKSCAEGPAALPPVPYINSIHGPLVDISTWSVTDKIRLEMYDKTRNTTGNVTVANCAFDDCKVGLGRPFFVIPGVLPDGVMPCDPKTWPPAWPYDTPSGYVGPYTHQNANAYATCVDFEPGNGTDVGGRVIFTDLSGSNDEKYVPGGLNTKDFAGQYPNCVDDAPTY